MNIGELSFPEIRHILSGLWRACFAFCLRTNDANENVEVYFQKCSLKCIHISEQKSRSSLITSRQNFPEKLTEKEDFFYIKNPSLGFRKII